MSRVASPVCFIECLFSVRTFFFFCSKNECVWIQRTYLSERLLLFRRGCLVAQVNGICMQKAPYSTSKHKIKYFPCFFSPPWSMLLCFEALLNTHRHYFSYRWTTQSLLQSQAYLIMQHHSLLEWQNNNAGVWTKPAGGTRRQSVGLG